MRFMKIAKFDKRTSAPRPPLKFWCLLAIYPCYLRISAKNMGSIFDSDSGFCVMYGIFRAGILAKKSRWGART